MKPHKYSFALKNRSNQRSNHCSVQVLPEHNSFVVTTPGPQRHHRRMTHSDNNIYLKSPNKTQRKQKTKPKNLTLFEPSSFAYGINTLNHRTVFAALLLHQLENSTSIYRLCLSQNFALHTRLQRLWERDCAFVFAEVD